MVGDHRLKPGPSNSEKIVENIRGILQHTSYIGKAALSSIHDTWESMEFRKTKTAVIGTVVLTVGYVAGVAVADTGKTAYENILIQDGEGCLANSPYDTTIRIEGENVAVANIGYVDTDGNGPMINISSTSGKYDMLAFDTPGYNRMEAWPLADAPELIPKDQKTIDILTEYGCDLSGQTE